MLARGPSCVTPGAAAQTRMVSEARIRLAEVLSRSTSSKSSSVIAIICTKKLKPRSFPIHDSDGTVRMPNPVGNPATPLTHKLYESDMVTLLEIKTAFGPEDTAAMTTAFEEALKRLNVADREAHMAISVAKKIVRLAKRGECNPTRLTEAIISSFRANPMPM
jgi:hypothetical protein